MSIHRYLFIVAAAVAILPAAGALCRLFAAPPDSSTDAAAKIEVKASVTEFLGREVRLVDLTHPFDEQTVYWPTEIPFQLERGFNGVTKGGWYYSANRFRGAEHCGTHVDAPIHFHKAAETVDEIPLDRLVGAGCMVDVTRQCAADPDFLITTDVLQAWEAEHRLSLDGKIVLLYTGFAKFWPDRTRYLGTAATGAEGVAELHFPGLDPVAAAWLVTERHIKSVGIDTASIDNGPSKTFRTHVVLCGHGVPAFENVAHLDELSASGFDVMALPMKIRGGSGGPLRIVAAVPQ